MPPGTDVAMTNGFVAMNAWQVMGAGLVFFAALYLVTGTVTWWLTRHLLPSLRYGRVLDPRPLPAGQLRRELRESAVAIFIFGAGLVFPWGLLRLGWAGLASVNRRPAPCEMELIVDSPCLGSAFASTWPEPT